MVGCEEKAKWNSTLGSIELKIAAGIPSDSGLRYVYKYVIALQNLIMSLVSLPLGPESTYHFVKTEFRFNF